MFWFLVALTMFFLFGTIGETMLSYKIIYFIGFIILLTMTIYIKERDKNENSRSK